MKGALLVLVGICAVSAIAHAQDLPLADVVSSDITAAPASVGAAPIEVASPFAVAPVAPAVPAIDPEIVRLREELKEKELVIARLSKHLESALGRINEKCAPATTTASPKVAALMAERLRLEQENSKLTASNKNLSTEMDSLAKKSQLLDLENRQLFAALSASPKSMSAAVVDKKTTTKAEKPLVSNK